MKTFTPSSIAVLALIVITQLLSSGCASSHLVRVQPWERSTLVDYAMQSDRDPIATTMDEHVYFSREAASGGRGIGGSGCGCN